MNTDQAFRVDNVEGRQEFGVKISEKKKLNISQKYVDLSTTMTLRFSSQSVKLLRLIVWSLVLPT